MDHLTTSALIARGRELNATITAAQTELKHIEAELRHRALAMPHEPLADGNREGRRATLKDGTEALTVLFESDILKASFDATSPTAGALLPLLNHDQITSLFRCKTTYERTQKDGHKFRILCTETLPADLASLVIDKLKDRDKNGIVKSKSVIEWKV
jgi:hypothetical protein